MLSHRVPGHRGPLSACLAALLLAPAVVHGATYHVAPPPTGDDAAAGTETAPWATLQHAADTVAAGDEVVVADGTYIGFQLATTGTAAAPIVFRAAAEAAEVTSSFAPDGPGILLDGASWVTVEGFRISGAPAAGIQGSSSAGSLQGLVLRGNEVADCGASSGAACIVLVAANDSTLDSNVLHGCGGAGIELPDAETTRVENNIVYETGGDGILSHGGDHFPGPNDLVVVNNTVHVTNAGGWALRLHASGGTGNFAFDNILLAGETAAGSIALEVDAGFASARNATDDRYSTDDGVTTMAMSTFQASGYELGSLVSTATALFVDGSMGDYRLRAGCPAVNAGVSEMDGIPASVLDIRGTRRPVGASWDLGAYEYCAGWTCDGADADADADADGGADADADAAADVPHDGGGDSGCGCRAGGAAGGGHWLLVLGCWSLLAGGRLLVRRSGRRKSARR